jgi:hypothetical protein
MKCEICSKKLSAEEINNPWSINAAVLGEYIELTGHKICCEAVNQCVVIPNRVRVGGK